MEWNAKFSDSIGKRRFFNPIFIGKRSFLRVNFIGKRSFCFVIR